MRVLEGILVLGLLLAVAGCRDDASSGDGGGTSDGTGSGSTDGTGSTGPGGTGTDGSSGSTGSPDSSGSGTGSETGGAEGENLRVVFFGDLDTPELPEIHAVDYVDGVVGEPVKVNHELPAGGSINTLVQVSPDARWIAYRAWTQDPEDSDLYVVDVSEPTIGVPVNLSVDPVPDPGVTRYEEISPVGDKVAFRAGPSMDGPDDIYVAALDTADPAPPTRVNPPVGPDGEVDSYSFSPDGSLFLYGADLEGTDIHNLYVQDADPVDPGVPTQVTDNTIPGVTLGGQWLPDSRRIVYWDDDDGDGVNEVFVADVTDPTGEPIRLDPADAGTVEYRGFAPDLRAYLYGTGTVADEYHGDLWLVPFDGVAFGPPVLVNTIGPGGDVYLRSTQIVWFPDSSKVAYLASHDDPAVREAWVVRLDDVSPGTPQKINGPVVAEGVVSSLRLSPTGSHLYYFAEQDAPVLELYRVASTADGVGAPERLHPPAADYLSGELTFHEEAQLLFTGRLEDAARLELFHTDVTVEPPVTEKVNPDLTTAAVTYNARFSPSGRHIAYSLCDPAGAIGCLLPIYLVDLDRGGLGQPVLIVPDSDPSSVKALVPLP